MCFAVMYVRLCYGLLSAKASKLNCKERARGTYPLLGLGFVVDIADMRSCVAR